VGAKSSVNHHSIVEDENMHQQAYTSGQIFVTVTFYLKREKKLEFPIHSIKVDVQRVCINLYSSRGTE